MLKLRDKIIYICQYSGEPLYEVWHRFEDKIVQCPDNEMPEKMILQIFDRVVDQLNRTVFDSAYEESLIKLPNEITSSV